MAKTKLRGTEVSAPDSTGVLVQSVLVIAERGMHTTADVAAVMAAVVQDVLMGNISPEVAFSASNATGKLLKAVEMEYRFGSRPDSMRKALQLVNLAPPPLGVSRQAVKASTGPRTGE